MLHQPPVAFLAPLQCLLRLLAFGHVASDQREAAQLTLGVAQSRDYRIGPQRRAVLAQPPAFFLKAAIRSEEHTSELQSRLHLVCRLLLEKKKETQHPHPLGVATRP